jgi:ubiquinone/menaquinone biosynthesis C-methylase UbiE
MSSSATDFGPRAAAYDELRPVGEAVLEVLDTLAREADLRGRRLLDVGCGTGRLTSLLAERYQAKVWGVDPSPEMLEVARSKMPRGIGLKLGHAEDLPFRDGWFERTVMTLVVHHVDRPRAFAEVGRVLQSEGRFGISTPDPENFPNVWLSRFFPSYVEIEQRRFPGPDALDAELRGAGFSSVRVVRLEQEHGFGRELALRKLREKYGSTFDLIPEAEYRAGLARAERDLPEQVSYRSRWLVVVAAR